MNKPHKSRNSEPNEQSPRNIFEIFSCSWAPENFSPSRGLRTDISQKTVVGCPWLVASLAFCLQRKSRGKWKKNDTSIQLSWPNKLGQKRVYIILWTSYSGFYSQGFFLLLFSNLRVGRPPSHWFISFSRLPFPASLAWTLNVPMVFLISFARNATSN